MKYELRSERVKLKFPWINVAFVLRCYAVVLVM